MNKELDKVILEHGIEGTGRLYSLYRGVVVNNEDPSACNRLKVHIPGAYGGLTLWAISRNQHGSFGTNLDGENHGNGFKYLPPKIGDIVWVSFEFGDPTMPVWEYYGWSAKQIPPELQDKDTFGFITPNGNKIIFSEDTNSMDMFLHGSASIYSKESLNIITDGQVNLIAGEDHDTIVQLDGDHLLLKLKDTTIESTQDGVVVNGGTNNGIINIDDLTNKLNKLVTEVEKLRSAMNTHTHTCASPGSATSPSVLQLTSPISQFNKTDYEDNKFTH